MDINENLFEIYTRMFEIEMKIKQLYGIKKINPSWDSTAKFQDQIDLLKIEHYAYATRAHAEAIQQVFLINDIEITDDDLKLGLTD